MDSESNRTHWVQLAEKEWAKPSTKARKVRNEIVEKEIWKVLAEESFNYRSLLQLENLQLLESYLWPGYDEDSSNHHVLLMALMTTTKSREHIPAWNNYRSNPDGFSSFFRRLLSMSTDDSLATGIKLHVISFLLSAFQSLDEGFVRKECAPLVSISIWHDLHSEEARSVKFEQHGALKKAWRASIRRYESGEPEVQARLRFERSWLFTVVIDFVSRLYGPKCKESDEVAYCERILEFLSDLLSQLPTRRYVNALLQDLNLLALIQLSPLFKLERNGLFRDVVYLFQHYSNFPIDDHTGVQLSRNEVYEQHCARLARLQRSSLKRFKAKLTILALSNYGAVERRSELETHISSLTDDELIELSKALGIRTQYPASTNTQQDKALLLEAILVLHEKRNSYWDRLAGLSVIPTEADLYDPSLLRNEVYDGSRSLAIPKLNLQYLTAGDFLWRSFVLYRCETFFEIRKTLEDTIKRIQPSEIGSNGSVQFSGFSRMALPITKPSVIEVAPPKVGFDQPAFVRAEIALNVGSLADHVRLEWDSLRPGDSIFLLAVQPPGDRNGVTNGHIPLPSSKSTGLLHLRTAEVVQLLDEGGRRLRDVAADQNSGYFRRPRMRKLLVNLDSNAYQSDEERKTKGRPDVYEKINLIVRRRNRENNFRPVLQSIKDLALSEVVLPSWLQEAFLGYGDPRAAQSANIRGRLDAVDSRDTFLDWQHLIESLPGKVIEPDEGQSGSFGPPYVMHTVSGLDQARPPPSKKRRKDESVGKRESVETVKVSTYRPLNSGPYLEDAPKKNSIRFTPMQVEAILSGIQPGLSIIVGPPGTGKTDVATQIINNIYHDFPMERTLLIAHSNQALNQLFQKITRLDIDQRHLLRLGHGEGDLETEVSYGKQGRVESFLDNRARLLPEVNRLAESLGAPGAHGNSCETAGYFNVVYVKPAWKKFWDTVSLDTTSAANLSALFPFHYYFSNAPQLIFPLDAAKDEMVEIAHGCERHIDKIFTELEDIRPFEILRNARDKANYLLVKEARIIAMTSTHAAMRRSEIADLGFHYENVVMEEAAQITEIENFIPFALQNPQGSSTKNGTSGDGPALTTPLKRIVMCGDHLQNSPIVQNLAFRNFANLEQSLFLRFVRLGVPVINLDQQGRARSSIADLYRWRYTKLGDLPAVLQSREFLTANAGLRYEYQFIDVPDYKGRGEMQPSPHFSQNLGEAEYAVAIYQYMRLLGYAREKISILTTYAGQRALIRDVLQHRCAKNTLFGMPRIVQTVDKYQGEQNDFVILSLVRTSRVGYLRDVRRLTVALSRARLGLYILGRRDVFEFCYELKEAFAMLFQRPDRLMLVPGEMHPTERLLDAEVVGEGTEMVGVEHLGQYVFEMTKAKVEMLPGREAAALPEADATAAVDGEEDEDTVREEGTYDEQGASGDENGDEELL
ncbi:hypothetical protein MMC25_005446 [Agyrium rufum]|nr:hypothetical protein [Agyrium rufum]